MVSTQFEKALISVFTLYESIKTRTNHQGHIFSEWCTSMSKSTGRSAARVWGDQLVMSNYTAGCSSAQTVINEIHSKFKGSCLHRAQEQDGCRMAGRGPGSDVIKYQ